MASLIMADSLHLQSFKSSLLGSGVSWDCLLVSLLLIHGVGCTEDKAMFGDFVDFDLWEWDFAVDDDCVGVFALTTNSLGSASSAASAIMDRFIEKSFPSQRKYFPTNLLNFGSLIYLSH
jgi:hypothetical protein